MLRKLLHSSVNHFFLPKGKGKKWLVLKEKTWKGKRENCFSILLVRDWDLQPGGSNYLKGQAGGGWGDSADGLDYEHHYPPL